MNSISKLFSLIIIISFVLATPGPAYAEYYMVYASAPCCTVVEPIRVVKHVHHHYHHVKKVHHRHHRHHYRAPVRPKNTYSISVYYACPTYGCCNGWTPCSVDCAAGLCGRPYEVYYDEPVVKYKETCAYTDSCADASYVYDETGINLDRRTADDVGSDMNIDY